MDLNKSKDIMERMGLTIRRPMFDCAFDIFTQTGKVPIIEGFFKSYDAGFIIRTLRQKFGFGEDDIRVDIGRKNPNPSQIRSGERGDPINDEILVMEILLDKEHLWLMKRIEPFMNACGWYYASTDETTDNHLYIVVFEKRIQEKEPEEYKAQDYLYHITPISRLERIRKNGLTPKTHAKLSFHPERIYLFPRELSDYEISYWVYQLSEKEKEQTIKDGYAVLKIDREKCGNIKLFADPNMDGAAFTTDNIPPTAITTYKVFKTR